MVLLEIQVQFPQVLVQGSQVQVQVQAEQVQVQGHRARLVRVLVFILPVMMRRFQQGRGSPSGFRRL
jgi:hypothetical protein